jgi:hypothetical protein
MNIRNYRNFQIHVYNKNHGFYAEVIRKDKLIQTVKDPNKPGGLYDSVRWRWKQQRSGLIELTLKRE